MTVAQRARKLALTAHVVSSVGWLGAVTEFLALAIAGRTSDDPQLVRGTYLAMEVVGWYVIVPLCGAALATGLLQGVITKWGLLQHYWVTISLGVTLFAAAMLVLHLPAVDELAAVAADPEQDVSTLGGDLFHSLGGLVVLSIPLALNVVKPRGLTRRGWRMRPSRHGSSAEP